MPSNHLILCHLLLLLPSIFPSIRALSNESALCISWLKGWSFSFSINPSNDYSRLISFRMDWLDLLAVQGTLKSLLQHQSSKTSILWRSAFIWSNSHIRTWLLEIALTRRTFVGKVMSLLFNMLFRFVIGVLVLTWSQYFSLHMWTRFTDSLIPSRTLFFFPSCLINFSLSMDDFHQHKIMP